MSMSPFLSMHTVYVLGIVFLTASRSSPSSRPWDFSRRMCTVVLCGIATTFTAWAACAATAAHDQPCVRVAPGLGSVPFYTSCRISLIPASIRSSWVLAPLLCLARSSYRFWSALTYWITFFIMGRLCHRGPASSSFVRLFLTLLSSSTSSCQSWAS